MVPQLKASIKMIQDNWQKETQYGNISLTIPTWISWVRKQRLVESVVEIKYIIATEATFSNFIDRVVNSWLRKFNTILKSRRNISNLIQRQSYSIINLQHIFAFDHSHNSQPYENDVNWLLEASNSQPYLLMLRLWGNRWMWDSDTAKDLWSEGQDVEWLELKAKRWYLRPARHVERTV